MLRYWTISLSLLIISAVGVGVGLAQTQVPAGQPGPGVTMPEKTVGTVEGKVKKADPITRTVDVASGMLGIFGKTLEVNPDTQVQVDGRQGSLADIREGAKVKASYESQAGRNIASRIEVLQGQGSNKALTPPQTAPTTP